MAKSKYETHVQPYLDKITEWLKAGATYEEICDENHLNIGNSTFLKYKRLGEEGDSRYIEFVKAITSAREEPNEKVEAALFKLACGYNATVKKMYKVRRYVYDPCTGRKIEEYDELVPGEEEVHVAANERAQEFWLANMNKEKWSYKPETKADTSDDSKGIIEMPAVMERPADEPKEGGKC